MPALQPTADQFRSFRDDPHDGPIAQVNLLKYRVRAAYAPGDPEYGADESGAAAYQRYVDAFTIAAAEVGGICLLHSNVERFFIGAGDWDAVLVMHFPSRAAFMGSLGHGDYVAMTRHREAGLLCQELIVTRPVTADL
ncbi:DUF1330 domain-containing protein [Euzebya tangerina]|uniref:DUF1330 domain-containing protein n=1 Tax=Euzebya tangerina TaxID=591198 RepID=UPI000E317A5E|nr:DUF1330 domain-containing protein [Euzebya tangerina]